MRLVFLGTSGSVPTPRRNLPAIAIRRKEELIFLDCGEGTQRQMMGASLGFPKTIRIFLSHLHPDHVWGIPGLIHTLTMQDYKGKIQLYGPPGVENYLRSTMQAVNFHPTFPVEVQTIESEGNILTEEDYRIQSTPADHNIPALAYSLTEKERPGRFDREKAERLGIPEGPLRSKLQRGETITLPNGRKVSPEEIIGKPRKGRKITYSGDTRPSQKIAELAKGSDLLIHEATFDDSMTDRAAEDGHSTPSQAAAIAKKARVERLALTHISARYEDPTPLLEQAKRIFNNTFIAEDLMQIELKYRE